MKIISFLFLVLLPGLCGAQVKTMSRLPAANTNNTSMQAPAAAQQSPANLFVTVLTCTEQNLTEEYQPVINFSPSSRYYSAVIIDNPLTNNNPGALIMVVPVRYDPVPFSLYYDQHTGRWKIRIEHNSIDDRDRLWGSVGPDDPKYRGIRQIAVLDYSPKSLQPGDKFNILVNQ